MRDLAKSLVVWVMIIPLAILNGGFRDKILTPHLGESVGLPMSGIILCLLILLLTTFALPKFARNNFAVIGIAWVVLTILFEFAFGFAMGESFGELLKAYDITSGNLWLLVVIFIGFAPYLGAKIRKSLS